MNEEEKRKKSDEIRELVKKKKIQLAPDDKAQYLETYVDQVLDAVGEALDDDGMKSAWISDESTIWDFVMYDDDKAEEERILAKISEILGVKVELTDYIVDIAKRLTE